MILAGNNFQHLNMRGNPISIWTVIIKFEIQRLNIKSRVCNFSLRFGYFLYTISLQIVEIGFLIPNYKEKL